MSPAELIVAAALSAAAAVPIAATLDQRAQQKAPAPTPSTLADRYSYQPHCSGGPCVVDRHTKEKLGL